MIRDLRIDQTVALDLLRQSLSSGNQRVMVQAPTGWGKTMLAAGIVDGALSKGKRVLFTVPALTLVDQTVDAFFAEGITDVGVLQANHPMTNPARPIQIASIQTLQRRGLPEADVVMIDEAHRWFDFYGTWLADSAWAAIPFIGLSATPWTRGLGKHYEDLIIASTTRDLIAAGVLSRFRVFAPSHPDLSGVRTVAGDYHEGDLSSAMDKPELVADVVTTWLQRGEARPTLCFGVDRAHAKRLEEQFKAAGVSTGYIDAFTPRMEREIIRAKFQAGHIRIVCNVGCLTTGVDWDVRCIILARPTKSEMLFVQIIGRGLRTAEGKDDCLILDHSDTHLRLGFVTDIHHDSLDDGRERPKAVAKDNVRLPKECPSCSFLKPPKAHACPSCGFAPERRSDIETVDGELVELTGRRPKPGDRQRWYSMLLYIAAERGYKRGWAAQNFRQKFGRWPKGLSEHAVAADNEVINYVRGAMIRYAKRRERHAA